MSRPVKSVGKPTNRVFVPGMPGLAKELKPEECTIIETDGPLTMEFKAVKESTAPADPATPPPAPPR